MSRGTSPGDGENRKRDHLRLVLDGDVHMRGLSNGLERWRLAFDPFPDLDLAEVDTTSSFLDRDLSMPFLIGAMSGGVDEAQRLNQNLARAAAASGVGLELGSMRLALEASARGDKALDSFDLRALMPGQPLLGNLGATLLHEQAIDAIVGLSRELELDALSLHLNPLHEAFQRRGDTSFSGLRGPVRELHHALNSAGIRMGLKTVGFGAGTAALARLAELPCDYLELNGAGGTSFTRVEAARLGDSPEERLLAKAVAPFLDFGVPLADGLRSAAWLGAQEPRDLVAGGGLKDGVDLLKVLALGARLGSMAAPLLAPALESAAAVSEELDALRRGLSIAMFVCNCRNLDAVRSAGAALLEEVIP